MALKSIEKINAARFGITLSTPFGTLALLIGLLCKIYFINTPLIDPGVTLPKLALEYLILFLVYYFHWVFQDQFQQQILSVNCISNLYKDIFDFKKLEKIKYC